VRAAQREVDGSRKDTVVACILIVEDEPNIVKLISFRLQRLGHEIIWARDGLQALEAARNQQPDLILLDVLIPLMNGFEVLAHLKSAPETQTIPVLMLTARSNEQDVVAGLSGGAEDYIIKPFSFPELIARVNTTLARHMR
jgi:DNA-binding response OmpR family regulator